MPSSMRLLFLGSLAAAGASPSQAPLTLLTPEQSLHKGAVCLDGGPPGFYYKSAEPKLSTDPHAATSWLLYFKGGGWCYDEAACAKRAAGILGNSTYFPKTFDFAAGLLDSTTHGSPVFAGFHHVMIWYCDGASFTGNRDEPYEFTESGQTTKLYFRGRRILDAILDVLLDPEGPYGLGHATQVLLSGGSAGGLSTFLHADYIATRLPTTVTKYKAAPISGFFLLHNSEDGKPLYVDDMQYVFKMQNSSGGVNSDCLEAGHDWRCMFANYSYAYSKTPMFPLQSSLDSWQMLSLFNFPDRKCLRGQFDDCSSEDIGQLNGYADDLVRDFQRTKKFHQEGEGGFIESCYEHVAAQSAAFHTYEIGGVREVDAISEWWLSDREPAAKHWYLPCSLSVAQPHQCNPSCGATVGGCIDDNCGTSDDVTMDMLLV